MSEDIAEMIKKMVDLLIIKYSDFRSFLDRWSAVYEILAGTHPSIPLDTPMMTHLQIRNRCAIGDQFINHLAFMLDGGF